MFTVEPQFWHRGAAPMQPMVSSGTTPHAASDIARLLEVARSRQRSGALHDADKLYTQILTQDNTCAAAWFLRSTVALAANENTRAVEQLEAAVRHSPQTSLYHCHLGEAYRRLGRIEDAVIATRQAITLKHDFAEAHRNLGILLEHESNLDGALASFEAAWRLQPTLPDCAARIVSLLRACGRTDDAIGVFYLAERQLPNDLELAAAGAAALTEIFRFEEALAILRRHLASSAPGMLARVHAALGKTLADSGEVAEALTHLRRAVELVPSNATYLSTVLHLMPLTPGVGADDVRATALCCGSLWQARAKAPLVQHRPLRASKRLRIGYVSGCLRSHPDVHFLLPLITHHNPQEVSVVMYSNTPSEDEVTREIRSAVEGFTVLRGRSDVTAAQLVRRDEVDVLVDVTGHAEDGRPGVFARRPAPVQVTWLAHPATTGLPNVDFALADRHLAAGDTGAVTGSTREFTEALYPLEHALWCYAPLADTQVNRLPAISRSWFTFGSFCIPQAINDATLALWAEVLRSVSNARLRLLALGTEHQQRLTRAFERHGIGRVRLDFAMPRDRDEQLREYHLVDCCLDTVPCNGVLSTFDAWWMGVPVISQRGVLASGRVGHAVACHLGLQDFTADTREGYVALAVRTATNLDVLAALRKTSRQRLEQSPLMDGAQFARSMEAAYRALWSSRGRA